MKILQVMAGAAQGGAETAFEDIVLALHEAGISQHIVTRQNNGRRIARFLQAGLSVDTLPFGGFIDFYTSYRLRQIADAFRPDIVQTWMSRASQKMPRVPYAVNIARLGGYYNLKYFKNSDYFIGNTPDIAKYIVKQGVSSDRVTHINGFAAIDDNKVHVQRADLNTPPDATVALVLARYHPVKGLDVLIKAASRIPALHVWLAGEGPEEANLRALAQSLNIEDRIHFLGWRDDRNALLAAADMCIIPSRSEPFGNVMVQAWAAKKPLICTKSEGPSQYARHGDDALMVAIDNIDELVQAITGIIANPDLAQKISVAGYARFVNEFSKEKTVTAYRAFYEGVLAARNV